MSDIVNAARDGDAPRFSTLLSRGSATLNEANALGQQATHMAAYHGRLDMLRALAKAGADFRHADHCGWTPAFYAFQSQHAGAISLIQQMAPESILLADDQGDSLLHQAVRDSLLDSVRWSMSHAPDLATRLNEDGDAPAHLAARQGFAEALEAMIDAGYPLDFPNASGSTVAELARDSDHEIMIPALQARWENLLLSRACSDPRRTALQPRL